MGLEGLAVPTPTIFGPDGELLPGQNARFTRNLCDAGVDHIFAAGTLGEFPLLNDAERELLVESVIESLTGHADAWIGVGAPSTRAAVANAVRAEEAGAAALVVVPPYFLRPTVAAIDRYYRDVKAAVGIPVLAYNIPSCVGYPLAPELVHALARDGVLHGIKDTSGSLSSVRSFLEGAPPGFAVVPGNDEFASASIAAGAAGAVMGIANILPKLCVQLVAAARGKDTLRAAELQRTVDRMVDVTRTGPFPATDKFLSARLRGAEVGYRAPYGPLTPDEERRVMDALAPHANEFDAFR